MTVTVVDYDIGNLLSVQRALEACGAPVRLAREPGELADAERILLPGVGAFGRCIAELRRRGLADPIRRHAAAGRPLLGVCVGFQLLFDGSEEFGEHEGLGLIPGRVRRLQTREKLPHIGWAPIQPAGEGPWADGPLAATAPGSWVYFLHSFGAEPAVAGQRCAVARYGGAELVAAARAGPVAGVQFHPEKSGEAGLGVLRSFLAWRP